MVLLCPDCHTALRTAPAVAQGIKPNVYTISSKIAILDSTDSDRGTSRLAARIHAPSHLVEKITRHLSHTTKNEDKKIDMYTTRITTCIALCRMMRATMYFRSGRNAVGEAISYGTPDGTVQSYASPLLVPIRNHRNMYDYFELK